MVIGEGEISVSIMLSDHISEASLSSGRDGFLLAAKETSLVIQTGSAELRPHGAPSATSSTVLQPGLGCLSHKPLDLPPSQLSIYSKLYMMGTACFFSLITYGI